MSDRIVADVRSFSKSTGYAKFLLLTIASHIHYKAEYAYPSLATLAREITLSKPTVIKLLRVLEDLEELEVHRGHGRGQSNRYRITITHEAPEERSDEEDIDQPKGKPRLYLLPTASELEKVKTEGKKVNDTPEKGKASVDPKEVLRTLKDNTERHVFDIEQVSEHQRLPPCLVLTNDEKPLDHGIYGLCQRCRVHVRRGGECGEAPWLRPSTLSP